MAYFLLVLRGNAYLDRKGALFLPLRLFPIALTVNHLGIVDLRTSAAALPFVLYPAFLLTVMMTGGIYPFHRYLHPPFSLMAALGFHSPLIYLFWALLSYLMKRYHKSNMILSENCPYALSSLPGVRIPSLSVGIMMISGYILVFLQHVRAITPLSSLFLQFLISLRQYGLFELPQFAFGRFEGLASHLITITSITITSLVTGTRIRGPHPLLFSIYSLLRHFP